MKSILSIYNIGIGPSSSHSMGPRRAAKLFVARQGPALSRVEVELYGSLSATGKGHLIEQAIAGGLGSVIGKIVWCSQELPGHPNGMVFRSFGGDGKLLDTWRVYSVGGGQLADDTGPLADGARSYPCESIAEVLAWCVKSGQPFWAYALDQEGPAMWDALDAVWRVMRETVERGLASQCRVLPGGLGLQRRAGDMLRCANERVGFLRDLNLLSSYALAVAEENGSGGEVVTAPTCGSAGVLPAVLYYQWRHHHIETQQILRALATAGLFGTTVAHRSSISGAQVGCQGEIGTACAMAAAAAAELLGGLPEQVEYAAEMGLEHCLGLTCDPIGGLVQVPCIERNAFAAMRSVDCAAFALATDGRHLVGFDDVVDVMHNTGRDLQAKYRETASGGLAAIMRKRFSNLSPQPAQDHA